MVFPASMIAPHSGKGEDLPARTDSGPSRVTVTAPPVAGTGPAQDQCQDHRAGPCPRQRCRGNAPPAALLWRHGRHRHRRTRRLALREPTVRNAPARVCWRGGRGWWGEAASLMPCVGTPQTTRTGPDGATRTVSIQACTRRGAGGGRARLVGVVGDDLDVGTREGAAEGEARAGGEDQRAHARGPRPQLHLLVPLVAPGRARTRALVHTGDGRQRVLLRGGARKDRGVWVPSLQKERREGEGRGVGWGWGAQRASEGGRTRDRMGAHCVPAKVPSGLPARDATSSPPGPEPLDLKHATVRWCT